MLDNGKRDSKTCCKINTLRANQSKQGPHKTLLVFYDVILLQLIFHSDFDDLVILWNKCWKKKIKLFIFLSSISNLSCPLAGNKQQWHFLWLLLLVPVNKLGNKSVCCQSLFTTLNIGDIWYCHDKPCCPLIAFDFGKIMMYLSFRVHLWKVLIGTQTAMYFGNMC